MPWISPTSWTSMRARNPPGVPGGGEAAEHVHGRVRQFGMRTVRSAGADDAGTPSLPGVSHRFVDVAVAGGTLTLHVAEAGVGEPVLMLHGWPGHWYSWRHVVPQLSESYRLLMPDLRGFGWSDAPGSGYDPRTFAADTLALLDALELDRVRLVGHDWGGFTAFLLGLQHPERFSRIVVFNAPHPWAPFSRDVIASLWRTWYVLALASPLGPTLVTSPSFLPWFIGLGGRRHLFSANDAEIFTARLRHPARARASCLLYRSYLRTARDIFIHRRYDHDYLTVPTRLVFGTEDFYVPSAMSPALSGMRGT
jgi:pimeloyl-ACP methyl ester carboxylesterase